MNKVYLDFAATTPCNAGAVVELRSYHEEKFGNPSSAHRYGREAQAGIREARAVIAGEFDVPAERVIFTSGGTEADNLAITGAALASVVRGGDLSHRVFACTQTEHAAVAQAIAAAADFGLKTAEIGVDFEGQPRIPEFLSRFGAEINSEISTEIKKDLRGTPELVSIQRVNNITGAMIDVRQCAAQIKERFPQAIVHTDAVQAFGKVAMPKPEDGVDLASISAHKIGGPKGVGALVILNPEILGNPADRRSARLRPLFHGGGQEGGLRPGTQGSANIAAFGAAARAALQNREKAIRHAEDLRRFARAFLNERLGLVDLQDLLKNGYVAGERQAGSVVWNSPASGAPWVWNMSCPGLPSGVLVAALDAIGVAVSAGSACSSAQKPAEDRVLRAMGAPSEISNSCFRLSLGERTTQDEIHNALDAICRLNEQLRRSVGDRQKSNSATRV